MVHLAWGVPEVLTNQRHRVVVAARVEDRESIHVWPHAVDGAADGFCLVTTQTWTKDSQQEVTE